MTVSGSRISIIPVRCARKFKRFNLAREVIQGMKRNNMYLMNGDIVVVSSKFASISEGTFLNLDSIAPDAKARKLAIRYQMDPRLAKLVLDESEAILGGIPGFALTVSRGVLAPNSGIDRSNAPAEYVILYPRDPEMTAARLRSSLISHMKRGSEKSERPRHGKSWKLGIVLSDSRITPTRLGTTGVAIATAGFKPIEDLRGSEDLFGNELKVTIRALADQLASAAEFVMGEAAESIPIAIIRGTNVVFEDGNASSKEQMTIGYDRCLIVQGLRNGIWRSRETKH